MKITRSNDVEWKEAMNRGAFKSGAKARRVVFREKDQAGYFEGETDAQ